MKQRCYEKVIFKKVWISSKVDNVIRKKDIQ